MYVRTGIHLTVPLLAAVGRGATCTPAAGVGRYLTTQIEVQEIMCPTENNEPDMARFGPMNTWYHGTLYPFN